jgi:hypothetical protein
MNTWSMVHLFANAIKHPRYAPHMVAGGIVMVVILLLVVPIGVMLGGAAWSALMGFVLGDAAEHRAAEPAPGS